MSWDHTWSCIGECEDLKKSGKNKLSECTMTGNSKPKLQRSQDVSRSSHWSWLVQPHCVLCSEHTMHTMHTMHTCTLCTLCTHAHYAYYVPGMPFCITSQQGTEHRVPGSRCVCLRGFSLFTVQIKACSLIETYWFNYRKPNQTKQNKKQEPLVFPSCHSWTCIKLVNLRVVLC